MHQTLLMLELLDVGQRTENFSVPFSIHFYWLMFAVVLTLAIIHYRYTRRLESGRINVEQELASTKLALEQSEAQLQDARNKIRSLILSDPLTGLRNRRFITEYLDKDIAHVLRNVATKEVNRTAKNHIYFLLVELDQLSEINAVYGMSAGDFVLKKFAKLLTEGIRKADIPVRWSGSEFLVVCRHCERTSAKKIAERFCKDLQDAVFNWNSKVDLKVTCSMGYCPFPFSTEAPELWSWEDVVHLAKKALLAAQAKGGNTYIGIYPGGKVLNAATKNLPLNESALEEGYISMVERDFLEPSDTLPMTQESSEKGD